MANFDKQVKAHADKYKRRLEATFKASAQELFSQAQAVASEGGKMRILTGFLRGSFSTSINGQPQGPSRNPYTGTTQQTDWDQAQTVVTIAGAKLGDTIWGGWSANYAQIRESKDGFMRSAAQNWPLIVNRVAADAKARIR